MSFESPSPTKRLRKREVSQTNRNVTKDSTFPAPISTPFHTPFKSRRSLHLPDLQDSDIKRRIKKLKVLLNKQWYFFNVSPLYNMSYSEVPLKRYARRLKEKLMSRLADQNPIEYEVSYSPHPNLQLNDMDHEAIEILVVKIAESGIRSIAYNGILLSWGATSEIQPENATVLPILICHGLKNLIKQVHWEFQYIHDCYVSPFPMHDEELRILSVGILGSSTFEGSDEIKLRYNLPQNKKSGQLDISLPTIILSDLWKCIHSTSSQQWTDVEVTTFWTEVYSHTYRSFGIDLGRCGLAKVTLPTVAFTNEAVLAKRNEQMYLVLSYLMSLDCSITSPTPKIHEITECGSNENTMVSMRRGLQSI